MSKTIPWDYVEPPFDWSKHKLVVIGDRYVPTEDGQDVRRQHVVQGSVEPGLVLDNADIFGEDEPQWVEQMKEGL